MTIAYHSYTNEWENTTYLELIKKRKELIEYITAYEEREIAGEHLEGNIDPSPDVVYQCRLEQLAQLCAFMKRKYNSDYVWEHKRLSDDV